MRKGASKIKRTLLTHLGGLCLVVSVCTAAVPGLSRAQIKQITVEKEGTGPTKKAAIMDAINEALTQINGAEIAASTLSKISETTKSKGNLVETASSEEMSKQVATATKGIISGYEIIKAAKDSALMGNYVVQIKVTVSKLSVSPQLKRRRVSIPRIYLNSKLSDRTSVEFANEVREKVVDFLTQTRKFAVIDRTYEKETKQELDRLRDPNVSTQELARLGNGVGIDFIVIPKINHLETKESARKSRLTGKEFRSFTAKTDATIRVIDVATSQLKFSKNILISTDNRDPSKLATTTARSFSDLIINAIFPPVVISAEEGIVTINQGGDSFTKGRSYYVYKLGRRLFDPTTKESLGREESELGAASVLSSSDRTARLDISKIKFDFSSAVQSGMTLIVRPKFDGENADSVPKIDVDKEWKKMKKRNENLKKKAKDDW